MNNSGINMQSIPYIIDETQGSEIQEEIELASVLLIALSRQENVHPEAIVKANYPFMVYDSEGETIVFDLLGLTQTEKKWLHPHDISEILTELETLEEPRIHGLLKKGVEALERDPNHGSTWVMGLIEQDEVTNYLSDSIKQNHNKKLNYTLFKPVLTTRKFTAHRKNIKTIQKEIDEHILATLETGKRLETIYKTIQKTQKKNLAAFKKESRKRLTEFKKEKDKEIKIIEKALKKDVKTLNDEFNERITNISTEMTATQEEIDKLRKIIESGTVTDEKTRLYECEKLLDRKLTEIKNVEFEHQNKLNKAEKTAESLRQQWEKRLQVRLNEEEKLQRELLDSHETVLKAYDDFLKNVREVEKTLAEDKATLGKISEIKYEKEKTLSIPFYIFNFGEENYGYYPPIKISEEKTMRTMLKLFISNNLENKITRFISPQTNVFNEILETVVNTIKEETTLSQQYTEKLSTTNLLESSETLDKMMVGLYQLMEWNWIKEKDYIQVQRFLLEKLDSLNGGTIFQVKQQPMDENVDMPEVMETQVIT
jgi:hypothetical protein